MKNDFKRTLLFYFHQTDAIMYQSKSRINTFLFGYIKINAEICSHIKKQQSKRPEYEIRYDSSNIKRAIWAQTNKTRM